MQKHPECKSISSRDVSHYNTFNTVYWEIFEVLNFRGLVILKFFVNKFSRMAIKARGGHVHGFKFLRLQARVNVS